MSPWWGEECILYVMTGAVGYLVTQKGPLDNDVHQHPCVPLPGHPVVPCAQIPLQMETTA